MTSIEIIEAAPTYWFVMTIMGLVLRFLVFGGRWLCNLCMRGF